MVALWENFTEKHELSIFCSFFFLVVIMGLSKLLINLKTNLQISAKVFTQILLGTGHISR